MEALEAHRLHFAFTVTFHYLFPQLSMGLALLLVYLKTKALRTGDEHYNRAARFWARIFGINFALGVVTGIPMEFQFGEKKLGRVGHWWAAFLVFLGVWLASGAKRGLCDDGAQRQDRSL
jgi:cytochrome bd-type quinol oxidase subunit 1